MKIALFLLTLCLAAPAQAVDSKTTVRTSADATAMLASNDDGKVVCQRTKKLGSHQTERVCTTSAERSAAKARAQADLDRLGRCSGNDSICSGAP